MATTDPLYGKKQLLKVGSTSTPVVITNLTSNGITKSRDTRDVTTKQSANDWREVRVSYKNGEINFEGIYTTEDSSVPGQKYFGNWEPVTSAPARKPAKVI